MQKIKKFIFIILMIILICFVTFLIIECFSRIFVGNRLIVKVVDNGLYHFKSNQEGWYHHKLRTPHAKINNIGARGDDVDVSFLDIKKYVFLGDSFTFGWELEDDETISHYFMNEMNLENDQVINYGNGGFGIDHMMAIYDFNKYFFNEDDVVIMIIIEDDFYRPLVPYKKSLIKEMFWKIREKSSSISWFWANFRIISNQLSNRTNIREDLDIFEVYGNKLLEFKDGKELIYVFYEYNQTDYSNKAKVFCKNNGLLCITDVYDSIKGENIYGVDGTHPSNDTNLQVAKRITNFINENVS